MRVMNGAGSHHFDHTHTWAGQTLSVCQCGAQPLRRDDGGSVVCCPLPRWPQSTVPICTNHA